MKAYTVCLVLLLLLLGSTMHAATVTFDGSVTYQVIDGFGVNANHRSWKNNELRPVLDALIDQAGMTLFRVVFDNTDWEETNDNDDPDVMNWTYYNTLYGSSKFAPLWNMFSYLNSRGITKGAFFNFMGPGPSWMGGGTLASGEEDEWAEMIASLLTYARNNKGLQFELVAPNNEPDIYNEGIHIGDASQYVTALHKLSDKLDANGLGDVQFVGPDLAGGGTTYMPEMMADSTVMSKLAHFGVHSYSDGGGSSGVNDFIRASDYPDLNFWMTEYNVWCSTCDSGTRGTYDWAYCKGTADYLLSHLANNASGGIVWEGYDSYYAHPPSTWSFWGLFSVSDENAAVKSYTPRKNFYTLAQITKWVHPGAQRIEVSGSSWPFSPLLAFKHADLGLMTIVGINTSGSAATLNGTLASLPAVASLNLYYTSAKANLAHVGIVPVNGDTFSATIPADCVFTLTETSIQLPTVSIVETDSLALEEGRKKGEVTVSRTGDTSKSLIVRYSVGGTAANGMDCGRLQGAVTIPAGQASSPIWVAPKDDRTYEGDETVVVTLLENAAYVIGSPNSASCIIGDNDPPPPTVTVEAGAPSASESGTYGVFSFFRTGNTARPLTVRYTAGGTATNGRDYRRLAGRVRIPANESSATVTLQPIGDNIQEGDETVVVTLWSSRLYQIGSPGSATVTIAP